MSNLETRLLGLTFPNPFILAAGPMTGDAEKIIQAFDAGWGGAVLETIDLHPRARSVEAHEIRSGRVRWGRIGGEAESPLSLEQWQAEIDRIRDAYPGRPLIASIAGDGDASSWGEVVRRLELHGVDAFEINAACPGFSLEGRPAKELGQDPAALAMAVGWARAATDLPLIVKLTPNVTDILPAARAALQAGADAFSATGGLSGIGGIDFDTFASLPSQGAGQLAGTYVGPGLRPVALRWTAVLAKALSAPIFGCGGVSTWQDAVEFLAVGASAVQVGAAALWGGVEIINALTLGLESYLEEHAFDHAVDFIGKALPNIVGFDDLDLDYKLVATLDEARCIGCEICVQACMDGGFQAISMLDKIAHIDVLKCDGCGLCVSVCPPDIITMIPREEGIARAAS